MSRSTWIPAAAAALVAFAVPPAQAGDRSRIQITIAPYWGWGGPVPRPGPRIDRHGYYDGYRDSRHGGYYGGDYEGHGGAHFGGPVIRFDYRYPDRYYRPGGYRPGGDLRYDGRRNRDYYYRGGRNERGDWGRDGRGRHDHGRGRDWRD